MGKFSHSPRGDKGLAPAHKILFDLVLEQRPLIRMLVRVSGFRDIDDGVQLALIQAWKLIRADRLVLAEGQDTREAISSWLVIVTRNALSTPRRKQRTDVDELNEGTASNVDPIRHLEARETLKILTYQLNREERAMLEIFATGDSLAAFAKRMGIPQGTIHTRLRKLRRILRERLPR